MIRFCFNIFLFLLAGLIMRLACAQDSAVQTAPLPVIHGKVNNMDVMVQGDTVAFMTASNAVPLLDKMDDKTCARDLHCTMQKNRTEAVVLSPEGIWLFDSPSTPTPGHTPENVTYTEPLHPVSETGLYTGPFVKPTSTHIPLEFPQPVATLHTGNEMVDRTPGILLVSSPVMVWLAETVAGVSNTWQTMTPIIEPTSTLQRTTLTTITQEECELIRKLTSISESPMPTPVSVRAEYRQWEDGSVWMETESDILTIRPSPGEHGGSYSKSTGLLSYSVKQAGTISSSTSSATVSVKSQVERATATGIPAETNTPSPLTKISVERSEGGKEKGGKEEGGKEEGGKEEGGKEKELVLQNQPETHVIHVGWDKNPVVLPFFIDGVKYLKIDPKATTLKSLNLKISEDLIDLSCGWDKAKKRLTGIFTHGFDNICSVMEGDRKISGSCHHFVNYLAFGMSKQDDYNFPKWYEELPFASVLPFDEKELCWGDIVQLISNGKLIHSMFYLGKDVYINKYGGSDIRFQTLSGCRKRYTSDSMRIVRVHFDYRSKELNFRDSYSSFSGKRSRYDPF